MPPFLSDLDAFGARLASIVMADLSAHALNAGPLDVPLSKFNMPPTIPMHAAVQVNEILQSFGVLWLCMELYLMCCQIISFVWHWLTSQRFQQLTSQRMLSTFGPLEAAFE